MNTRLGLHPKTKYITTKQVANCPSCGRFSKSFEERGYDGSFNQIWVTTHCSQCGTITISII